jgi:thioredoxin 1
MSECVTITEANFEAEVLQAAVPVLLDFWAPWCGPCKMLAPVLDQLAEEYAGRLKVAKTNVDEEAQLAARHNVVSIPTMVVYKGGEVITRTAGAMPKQNIEALFRDCLA